MLTMLLFFFNDTATTEIYTLSLHDALPISREVVEARDLVVVEVDARERDVAGVRDREVVFDLVVGLQLVVRDRKSTRLNSSHANISYAVFCLKKKKVVDVEASHLFD